MCRTISQRTANDLANFIGPSLSNKIAMVHLGVDIKGFKKDVLRVKFENKTIDDILKMTVDQSIEFFNSTNQKKITNKLKPLQDVGMGYIQLGQSSSSLSGGEAQRVAIARALANSPNLIMYTM